MTLSLPRSLALVVRNRMAVVSGLVLVAIVVVAVLAPLIAPHGPDASSLDAVLAAPSRDHPLGGDASGRDVLSRLLSGALPTLVAAMIALLTALLIGFPTGLVAGYYSSWLDSMASWVADLLMATPAIIILLTLAPIVDNDVNSVMVMLGVIISPTIYRLTRSTVRAVRNEPYVDAARVFGLSDRRIIARHVALVVRGPLIVAASIVAGSAIVIQAGLEFIGIGGGSSRVSWGGMLSESVANMSTAPGLIVAPGVAIGVTACAFALFGSSVADALSGAGQAERSAGDGELSSVDPVAAQSVSSSDDSDGDVRTPVRAVDTGVLLDIRDLHVGYPAAGGGLREVVSGVSLQVRVGEIVGLVGESGSGKSQTSFAALGLLPDEAVMRAGSFTLAGRDVPQMSAKERRDLLGTTIGYVPQEPMSNLDPCWTIGDQLIDPIRIHQGVSRKAARDKAEALLARVGIAEPRQVMAKYPHEISGGMAQRVLIAGAISCEPQLLIADEPTTALDVTVQAEVLSLLRDLQTERQLGILLVTHNLGVVADLCDRVAVMRHGVIVEDRPAVDLFARPEHEYTKLLLRSTLDDARPRADYALRGV